MSSTTTQTIVAQQATHTHTDSLYLLPYNEEERERLLAQHIMYTRLFSGRLVFPPISLQGEDHVLDVGTGSGAWLCDARVHLPASVHLYGIDIEPRLFPREFTLDPDAKSNVHLVVCSGTALPEHWSSKFALINQRLLISGYTRPEWEQSLSEMWRVLRPGGYAQLIEAGPEWVSGPATARHMLFLDTFFDRMGKLTRCAVYIKDMMKAAGFVDVTSEEVVMNIGKWAGEDGVQNRAMLVGAWRGMRDFVMGTGGCSRYASAEEYDRAMDEISEELDSMKGSHTTLRVFYGRKPVDD